MLNVFANIFKHIIGLGVGVLLLISGHVNHSATVNNKKTTNNTIINAKIVISPTAIPQIKPDYSVTVPSTPVLTDGFNFQINIKNISIEPFITWVVLRTCTFTDDRGNEYQGSIYMPSGDRGIRFQHAIPPGDIENVNFNRVGVNLYGGGGFDPSLNTGSGGATKRCQYDSNGNYVCSVINGLKIKNCTVGISTDTGEDTKFPLVINFPL